MQYPTEECLFHTTLPLYPIPPDKKEQENTNDINTSFIKVYLISKEKKQHMRKHHQYHGKSTKGINVFDTFFRHCLCCYFIHFLCSV